MSCAPSVYPTPRDALWKSTGTGFCVCLCYPQTTVSWQITGDHTLRANLWGGNTVLINYTTLSITKYRESGGFVRRQIFIKKYVRLQLKPVYMTGLRNVKGWGSWQGKLTHLFSIISRPASGPKQRPIEWEPEVISLEAKRPGREAYQSLQEQRSRMRGVIHSLPIRHHGVKFN
jgi:hypothetical protein